LPELQTKIAENKTANQLYEKKNSENESKKEDKDENKSGVKAKLETTRQYEVLALISKLSYLFFFLQILFILLSRKLQQENWTRKILPKMEKKLQNRQQSNQRMKSIRL